MMVVSPRYFSRQEPAMDMVLAIWLAAGAVLLGCLRCLANGKSPSKTPDLKSLANLLSSA